MYYKTPWLRWWRGEQPGVFKGLLDASGALKVGGKTGTGDNQLVTVGSDGQRVSLPGTQPHGDLCVLPRVASFRHTHGLCRG